jgi:hypothetical protein
MYLVPGLIDHCNEKLSDFLIKIRQEILIYFFTFYCGQYNLINMFIAIFNSVIEENFICRDNKELVEHVNRASQLYIYEVRTLQNFLCVYFV